MKMKQKHGSVENFIRDELKIRDESLIELKKFPSNRIFKIQLIGKSVAHFLS